MKGAILSAFILLVVILLMGLVGSNLSHAITCNRWRHRLLARRGAIHCMHCHRMIMNVTQRKGTR